MIFLLILLLSSITLLIALCTRCPQSMKLFALVPACFSFILLYVFASADLAQDRDEYYQWYLQSERLLRDSSSRDQFFSALLSALPNGLLANQFAVVLSGITFLLLACFLLIAARRGIVPRDRLPLLLLVTLYDRLFLDLLLNTTRSSLMLLIFLIGMLVENWPLKVVLWIFAIGIHFRLGIIVLLIYLLFCFVRFPLWMKQFAAIAGIAIFAARLFFDAQFFPQLALLEFEVSASEAESVMRGFTIGFDITPSLAAQISLGIIAPAVFVFAALQQRPSRATFAGEGTNPGANLALLSFALGTMAIGLALFPELAFAQRLFLIPILVMPLLLATRPLIVLALAKLCIIAFVIPAYLP